MVKKVQTLHPFAFEKEGKFSTPHLDYLISVYGAEKLRAHVPRNTKEQKALEALNAALSQLKTTLIYSITKSNDGPTNTLKKSQYNYYGSEKQCYVAVQPGTFQEFFLPEHGLENDVTSDEKTWGWAAVLSLRPHKKTLEDLCNELDVTFNTTMLQRTANLKGLLEKGGVVLRLPNSVADMGRASGFVVYLHKGYMDPKSKISTIEKAWVFGSERLAQMAINKYHWTNGVIVEVEVALKRVVGTAPDGQLYEALAALQKERMQEALKHMEIEALRERLAQLEANVEPVEPQDVSPKRKM